MRSERLQELRVRGRATWQIGFVWPKSEPSFNRSLHVPTQPKKASFANGISEFFEPSPGFISSSTGFHCSLAHVARKSSNRNFSEHQTDQASLNQNVGNQGPRRACQHFPS